MSVRRVLFLQFEVQRELFLEQLMQLNFLCTCGVNCRLMLEYRAPLFSTHPGDRFGDESCQPEDDEICNALCPGLPVTSVG